MLRTTALQPHKMIIVCYLCQEHKENQAHYIYILKSIKNDATVANVTQPYSLKEENDFTHQLHHEVSRPSQMDQGRNEQYFVPSVTSQ